jgi:hypothetical protein
MKIVEETLSLFLIPKDPDPIRSQNIQQEEEEKENKESDWYQGNQTINSSSSCALIDMVVGGGC